MNFTVTYIYICICGERIKGIMCRFGEDRDREEVRLRAKQRKNAKLKFIYGMFIVDRTILLLLLLLFTLLLFLLLPIYLRQMGLLSVKVVNHLIVITTLWMDWSLYQIDTQLAHIKYLFHFRWSLYFSNFTITKFNSPFYAFRSLYSF